MKKLLLFIAVSIATLANAQQFEVTSLQEVKTSAQAPTFHPRFMPDGKTLLVTSEGYDGLALVDIATGKYDLLTTFPGAGWCAEIAEDGNTILTRSIDATDFSQNIYALDVASKRLTPVVENIAHVNNIGFSRGVATIGINGVGVTKKVAKVSTALAPKNNILVTNENLKLAVYVNGVRNLLDPLAGEFGDWDPLYAWSSLSPDGKKILFYCKQDAYVCDLNGKNVKKVGKIQGPQWCGNDYVVGMNDQHDGYYNTKSDIVICNVNGTGYQQLTSSADKEIKMFPSVSADGSQIAYHTESGKLFVMTIKKK